MRPRVHPLVWILPFVLGVSAATAAEVALALLLYSGPGLMRSLTTVLAVEAAALGVGLWLAPDDPAAAVESLRRRWLFCLATFVAAAGFAASWSLVDSLGGTGLSQGLGLAFLAALPLYAVGSVLGTLGSAGAWGGGVARVQDPTSEPAPARGGRVGGAAAMGGAVGFTATGLALPYVFSPASLLLVSTVLLSGAGLVYERVLNRHGCGAGGGEEEPAPETEQDAPAPTDPAQ